MRAIRKESEVAVFCSSDQAAGKCFERGKYIASHTDVLRAGVGHAFSEYCGPEQRSSLNENFVGLSVFHENLNLSNILYDYECFYFGTEIDISKQLSNFL